jgi:protoporphyrinogen IX oxidase
MRWVLAFHIIFMVSWFAGLFYLPRLFVYHAQTHDTLSLERFKIMEKRLFYGIMTPAGILTTLCGAWLLIPHWDWYQTQHWMQLKLTLVVALWAYHLYCGYLLSRFKHNTNRHSATFYRWFNEVVTVLFISIVILVVVKPAM